MCVFSLLFSTDIYLSIQLIFDNFLFALYDRDIFNTYTFFFNQEGKPMQAWLTAFINQFGYLGVGLLIFLENIFPPIPSEVILTFSGFLTTTSSLTIPGMVAASVPGSIIGALVLYSIGRILNEERLERWLGGRIGRALHFKPADVHKAHDWFLKKGQISVFFCRFIPVVRSLISIPAGMAQMSLLPFILYTTVGSLIWNTVLISLGAAAGNSWEKVLKYTDMYTQAALVVLAVAAVLVAVWLYKKKKKKQS